MSKFSFRYANDLGEGVYAVDTGFVRPQFDASYIVTQRAPSSERIAIIDTGTNYSVPRILATLSDLECTSDQVDFIILTHVHLDHAGGAGKLMQACPQAQLVVHPRGAKHMIDPTALRAGAVSVYGEEIVEKDYGQLLPIEAERVLCAEDGHMINLAGRVLVCLDTPGHAKHHITIWDQMSHGAFTGDTFGLSYREFDTEKGPFILPTTTPIHFDPKALRISLKRIMALKPECIYPTHFSKLTGVPRLYQKLTDMLTQVENLGKSLEKADHRHELLKNGLLNLYIQELRNHGCQLSDSKIEQLLSTDIELNAQGMGVWLG
ncbi:MAG: MBL fold metallo-hydrolase [Betaproteobacteria bacterium]|jgi:glyoxylase-like metal-dependent hydrolase (beta-lactamase superfamily II)